METPLSRTVTVTVMCVKWFQIKSFLRKIITCHLITNITGSTNVDIFHFYIIHERTTIGE